MLKPHSLLEKQNIFQEILNDLRNTDIKSITNKTLKKMFEDKGCSVTDNNLAELKAKDQLYSHGIYTKHRSGKEKKELFNNVLKELLEKKVKILRNIDLIAIFREKYDVSLNEPEIVSLGFRELLEKNGILTKYANSPKTEILQKTIEYVKVNKIEIDNISHLHKYTKQFGSISRATLDNHLADIVKHIEIKNLKSRKRAKALEMSDEEIIVEVAKHYIKRGVYKITAAEFRKYTNSHYRIVSIEKIRNSMDLLKTNYDIVIVSQTIDKQENTYYQLENILNYLKIKDDKYQLHKVDIIDDKINISENNAFIVDRSCLNQFQALWDNYIKMYIKWIAHNRMNVKNALLDENSNLNIDTEKKQIICLNHPDLSISEMTFMQFVQLTTMIHKSSNKVYGVHIQNMYIGFLLYLHSENKIIIPFSYIYDICFSTKKVQQELPFFLSSHSVNIQFLQAIQEKRLNVKDEKYKRVFQFFLLSLPRDYPISKIHYSNLSELKIRNENDFRRVSEIFNTLGAHIIDEKPKFKYVDNYIKYTYLEKYNELIELFNKTMNRAYKLGDYSREKNVYKDWSSQYASFLDFIEENYSNKQIDESFLYQIFDYPDEENILTYQEYILNRKLSSGTKDKRFTPLLVAFSKGDKYKSLKNIKDNKPVFDNTSENNTISQKRAPITNPIVLKKLEEIVRDRPPRSDYYKILNIDKKYTKWWKHYSYIAPFEPLIILLHLYIPARGINLRLADRNSFLVRNDKGEISGYHFTHDKNKKRKTPYIAPNIWGDDLSIIIDFIEYSKVHFNTLKPIKYDKQNPNGILPLLPNAKGTDFYTEHQHMKYWKRVLLKAQVELNNENNIEDITLIYPVSDLNIPSSPDDVDNLSQSDMEKFQVRYDLHSLRHTGATKYANAGMPIGLVALLTGHIDMNVLQSVYIELNAQKMIAQWKKILDVKITGDMSLADAGNKLIADTTTFIKKVFTEQSPEELLRILKKASFVSIGSYLDTDKLTKYDLEDFVKIDPVFWSFHKHGICTSSICPQGLVNRCSLCPHFMTSPIYIQEVASQINLQTFRLAKYGNMIIENREKGNPQDNENIRKSTVIEMEDMLAWIEILRRMDEQRVAQLTNDETTHDSKALSKQEYKEESIFSLAPIVNSDHALLKLVYDSLELKEFEHESFQDASEKLVGKIIRYAARNNRFDEVDGIDKYQILEWFHPVFKDILSLEGKEREREKLNNILNLLSDKSTTNILSQVEIKSIEDKEL